MSAPTLDVLAPTLLRLELEDFYYHEADLLDSRHFTKWLDLLDENISYRVPISRNVQSSDTDREYLTDRLDVSWIDEGKLTLSQRVEQLQTGIHWCEEPVSRTSHLYTNIRVVDTDGRLPVERVTARMRFLVYRNRLRDEVDIMVGKRVDELVRSGDSWLIAKRTVYLDQTVLLAKNLTTFL